MRKLRELDCWKDNVNGFSKFWDVLFMKQLVLVDIVKWKK